LREGEDLDGLDAGRSSRWLEAVPETCRTSFLPRLPESRNPRDAMDPTLFDVLSSLTISAHSRCKYILLIV
jgi:hypothetical protein